MSTVPEPEFDLEKLFLPAWAQDSPKVNRYADFAGEERTERRFDDRPGRRPPRRDQPGGQRPRGARPDAAAHRGRRPDAGRQAGSAPRPEPPPPLPLSVRILPDDKGIESLARQIRVTGRAYPLFDIAQLILQRPERQQVRFDVKKNAEGQPLQPLFLCVLDETLWLSEDEAIQHVLSRHFQTFYEPEKTATEPPRGTYTFVAQCGLSGKILGPPNYHDYQAQLHKLHTERFSRMPFDAFKARVKIIKDEAVVKQWIEDHSFKTEYNCLNVPEPLKLGSREEVEQHFRAVHMATIIEGVDSHTLSGMAARQLKAPALQRAVRTAWEDQRRFPLQVATTLSQQLAGYGLQFFKVNRTVTHVCVARPHYLDLEATPVSEGVKRIVDFINSHPKCTRRKLLEALAPAAPPPVAAPVEAGAPATPAAPAESGAPAAPATSEAPAIPPETAPEQTALAGDLHWLIHEGHVIEFANGVLDTAKKPLPRPPKPEKIAGPAPAAESPVAPPGESSELASAPPESEPAAAPDPGEAPTDSSVEAGEMVAPVSDETAAAPVVETEPVDNPAEAPGEGPQSAG
jgi:hypothetical protein